jgi:hypothetical protein
MEGSCSTGQSRQWAVVPVEEEEEYVLSKDRGDTVVNVLCYKSEGPWFDSR